ncbi:MAG: hypothetical protein R3F61_26940 [Myxococcota bacterium]
MIDLLRDELLTPAYIKYLVDLVNEEADAAGAAARAEVDAVAAQLAEAKRRLDNLYRAIEDGALDLSILAPRIREVKAQYDELTATHAALAAAGTPVIRLADDVTITRYVERLQTALATGSVNTQRAILRSWISRIEADGTTLTVTFTLPRDVGDGGSSTGSSTNEGQNHGLTEVLPRVVNDGGGGSRTMVAHHQEIEALRTFCRFARDSRSTAAPLPPLVSL